MDKFTNLKVGLLKKEVKKGFTEISSTVYKNNFLGTSVH